MQVYANISLKNYLTMKIGGVARFMANVHNPDEVAALFRNATAQRLKIFVLGGGSNIIATDNSFNGLVMRIAIKGTTVVSEDSASIVLKIGAGEDLDNIVLKSVQSNLSGIEAMSAIPGTIGATPIQNSGAYGQEIADVIQSVDVFDTRTGKFITLSNEECHFSYRSSIFRDIDRGRYIITHVTIKLSKDAPQPPFYSSLQNYLDENNIRIYTPQIIRDAVIDIRKNKLPDYKQFPSVGSFFKNPIIESWQSEELKKTNPEIPLFDMGNGRFKVPAGWLIEQCGLKGQLLHGIRVFEPNCLVLINESAQSYQDLSKAVDEISIKVYSKFKIKLEQEPIQI